MYVSLRFADNPLVISVEQEVEPMRYPVKVQAPPVVLAFPDELSRGDVNCQQEDLRLDLSPIAKEIFPVALPQTWYPY